MDWSLFNLSNDWIVLVLKVLAAFFIPVIVGFILSNSIKRIALKRHISKARIYKFLSDSTKIISITFGLISALGTIGINVAVLITGLGLTGLGLSLALKDTISNFVAGLMLIIYDPFNIDSRIKVSDCLGKVIKMDLRYVYIKTETDITMIPNSAFLTSAVRIIDLDKEIKTN